jgi:hypothetical protein
VGDRGHVAPLVVSEAKGQMTRKIKVAEIECPHCHETIRIRKIDSVEMPPEAVRKYSFKELLNRFLERHETEGNMTERETEEQKQERLRREIERDRARDDAHDLGSL